MLETEDKDMLEAVLNGCYEHKATVGPIQEGGGVSTINVIYEKNGKLNILIKHMEQMSGSVVKEYAELTPTDTSQCCGIKTICRFWCMVYGRDRKILEQKEKRLVRIDRAPTSNVVKWGEYVTMV